MIPGKVKLFYLRLESQVRQAPNGKDETKYKYDAQAKKPGANYESQERIILYNSQMIMITIVFKGILGCISYKHHCRESLTGRH